MDAVQQAAFELGLKAVVQREDDDGTLYIEGYASDFQTDRDDEAFEPGAFDRGLKAYMESNPILLYHHDPSRSLGQIVEANLDGKGLKVKAMFPKPPAGSWAEHVYQQVKRGIIRGFSVGGSFKRRVSAQGQRIFDVDLQEISVTPLPVNPRTLFGVAGKAFGGSGDEVIDEYTRALDGLDAVFNTVEMIVSRP